MLRCVNKRHHLRKHNIQRREITPNGQYFGNPNPYNLSKKYGSTSPICTAVRPPFVSPYFPGFQALKKGKPGNTPPVCTAVRPPFVRQYAPHLYSSTFGKILGVGVTGTFLNLKLEEPAESKSEQVMKGFPILSGWLEFGCFPTLKYCRIKKAVIMPLKHCCVAA